MHALSPEPGDPDAAPWDVMPCRQQLETASRAAKTRGRGCCLSHISHEERAELQEMARKEIGSMVSMKRSFIANIDTGCGGGALLIHSRKLKKNPSQKKEEWPAGIRR